VCGLAAKEIELIFSVLIENIPIISTKVEFIYLLPQNDMIRIFVFVIRMINGRSNDY
jgi:hypothetical protein